MEYVSLLDRMDALDLLGVQQAGNLVAERQRVKQATEHHRRDRQGQSGLLER